MTTRPGDRWRQALLATAVPQAIIDAGPEAEVSLEPQRFRWKPEEDAKQPVRPSRRRALEALPEGGSVLDVGVGGGASSLGLVPHVGVIVGVDPMEGMLESFQASAAAAGVAPLAVLGRWPDVADQVEPADVAVCHHAMYRTADIEDFVAALTGRARNRVVVELSARSPLSGLDELWKTIHGIDRPDWLVADEAQAVIAAMGLAVEREDILLPPRPQEVTPEMVAFARRRLYVGPEHDPKVEMFLRTREPQDHRVAALWWPGAA
jgi:SAM-dependent methyltransferase